MEEEVALGPHCAPVASAGLEVLMLQVQVLQCFPDVTISGLEEEALVEEVLVPGQTAAAARVLVVAGEHAAPSQ